ncbi:winged helix-turn-helix transcriptional regulator [Allokutzneria sp. A3M-2-11 16]|uniref:winged helix-turn-helix transcriptional regulator n=1 Tax=Allokutzneria sp. A3M-2-11 16 TaxID=2962043 RepID=UPI0020B8AE18|nr:winged helix-turn-helix transcriptional regulator [Allokutzneria sp. A3M-2-11 16]MCP3803460.1 winged helix-turn-helix transcriptional regulator [Allokutzneria sp. A3M-2-11 16]
MSESTVAVLEAAYDKSLVKEILAAYEQAKQNYYLGGHRLSAVEGGRFCEAAYRILEFVTTAKFTPIGDILDTERVAKRLSGLPGASYSKSLRIYIPRALRVVYDIRNSRDAAHLGDGIDPNLQDATLVVSVLDWVLAEFIRLSGSASADVAQRLVENLVTRKLPVVQDFGSFPKILRTDLRAGDYVLVLLYHVGPEGARTSELQQWVPSHMRANLRRTLRTLESKALIHRHNENSLITYLGQKRVEVERLLDPDKGALGSD